MNIEETAKTLMIERLTLVKRLEEIDEQLLDFHKMIGVETVAATPRRYNESVPVMRVRNSNLVTKDQVYEALDRPMKTGEIGAKFMHDASTVRPLLYELMREGRITVTGRTNARLWKRVVSTPESLEASTEEDEPFIATLPQEVRSSVKPVPVRCFGPGFDPRREPCPEDAVVNGNITRRCAACARQHRQLHPPEQVTGRVVFDGTAKTPMQSLLADAQYGSSSLGRNV